ncbi:MAG TPA: fused MFS/spermidine synthase [Candidatus Eisenbacteria bacterium]|nr:fused MFS/spermidine synthase [Candidatus Eisenbacteria bacterium]
MSGAVSLVYQVLWMRELGLLFGNTAQAGATTLTAFFLGLALGGFAAGKIAPRLGNPLRAYGWIEIGVAVTAVAYFGLMSLYGAIVPALFRSLGSRPELFLLAKFGLGILVLLPPSCLIGATLPLVGEHIVRGRDTLGRGGTILYALNTLGAALGALAAGFFLPLALGFRGAYAVAIASNLVLGIVLIVAARTSGPPADASAAAHTPHSQLTSISWTRVRVLAFLSGLVTLALEVLWTRMFSQVLHNSVYTFSIILVIFLVALALGSLLAHRLIGSSREPSNVLALLLGAGAVLTSVSPWLFFALTGGLRYIAEQSGWIAYQLTVFTLSGLVMMPATIALGTVFPYLLRLGETPARSAGRTVGELVAINTLGGIAGSLLAGFAFLSWFGLWSSIRLVALVAIAGLPLIAVRGSAAGLRWTMAAASLATILITGLVRPPAVRLDPAEEERLVDLREGPAGTVAVIQNANGRVIKVNNHYTLGGTAALRDERRQGMLPLLLHPHPRDVYYLGMGTGITASAALVPGVSRITVCELVPDVITMARRHFGPYVGELFTDRRVRLVAEDGRTFLRATDERFDVIISDLFVPWEARTGSLYSLEHFRSARDHLLPGGVFAQWLPLYQLSRREFQIIARTMLEVFPHVTVWRGDLAVTTPTMALVGRLDGAPLDPEMVVRRLREVPDPYLLVGHGPRAAPIMWSYVGNLEAAQSLVRSAPLNTDDRPLIEYLAPVTHRRASGKRASFLIRDQLVDLCGDFLRRVPPNQDPYLGRLMDSERGFAVAGFYTLEAAVARRMNRTADADSADLRLQSLLKELFRTRVSEE